MKKFTLFVFLIVLIVGVVTALSYVTSEPTPKLHDMDYPFAMAFSRDDSFLITCHKDAAYIWSVPEQGYLGQLAESAGITQIDISTDGSHAVGVISGRLYTWWLENPQYRHELRCNIPSIYNAKYSASGKLLLVKSKERNGVHVLGRDEVPLASVMNENVGTFAPCWCLEDTFAVCTEKSVQFYDGTTGHNLHEIAVDDARDMTFGDDMIAIAEMDGRIRVFNVLPGENFGKESHIEFGHRGNADEMVLTNDGYLVSAKGKELKRVRHAFGSGGNNYRQPYLNVDHISPQGKWWVGRAYDHDAKRSYLVMHEIRIQL